MLVFAGYDCNGCRHHKNVTFEYSDTDRLWILNTRNRIRTDKNTFRPDRIRIQSKISVPFTSLDIREDLVGSDPRH